MNERTEREARGKREKIEEGRETFFRGKRIAERMENA